MICNGVENFGVKIKKLRHLPGNGFLRKAAEQAVVCGRIINRIASVEFLANGVIPFHDRIGGRVVILSVLIDPPEQPLAVAVEYQTAFFVTLPNADNLLARFRFAVSIAGGEYN